MAAHRTLVLIIQTELLSLYSKSEKLLGVKFNYKLSFNDHNSEVCKKTSRKMHVLSRETSYMKKRSIPMNAFFKS